MKSLAFSLLLLSAAIVGAESPAEVWPMPSPMPKPPAGTPDSAYPLPKLDWFDRVKTNMAAARKSPADIRLIFDGDSITDYWQSKGKGLALWEANYARLGAFDFGISGDRTQHVLWRLAQGQVDGLSPKLIFLMIGTNNIFANTPEEIALGVKTIVAEYRKRCPGAVIVVQALFPRGEAADDPLRARIKATNKLIAPLADGKSVLYLDFSDNFLKPDGSLSSEIMPDFLHPSPKGYEIWAAAIQPVIQKYLPSVTE